MGASQPVGEWSHEVTAMARKALVCWALMAAVPVTGIAFGAQDEAKTFRGVVTYHLIPAKVMRVNEIVEDPEPGTSYIGDKSITVTFDDEVDVQANFTVVDVEYHEYDRPRTISYELLGEEYQVTVDYYAESVVVDGDISQYIVE